MTRASTSQISTWMLEKNIWNQVKITMELVTCTPIKYSIWESQTKSKNLRFHWVVRHLTLTRPNSCNQLHLWELLVKIKIIISDLTLVKDVKSIEVQAVTTKVILNLKETISTAPLVVEIMVALEPPPLLTKEKWFSKRSFKFRKTNKITTTTPKSSLTLKTMLVGKKNLFQDQIKSKLWLEVKSIDISKISQLTWEYLIIQIIEIPSTDSSTEIL